MAEKPRLKETDEIFNSLGRSSSKGASRLYKPAQEETAQEQPAKKQPDPKHHATNHSATRQPDGGNLAPEDAPMISSAVDSQPHPQEDDAISGARPKKASKKGKLASEEPEDDLRPLNFGKYTLPKKPDPPPQTDPELKKRRKKPEPAAQVSLPEPEPEAPAPEAYPEIFEYNFESFGGGDQEPKSSSVNIAESNRKSFAALPAPKSPPKKSFSGKIPLTSDSEALSKDQHRENFLKRLSSQFDMEFNQKFEDNAPGAQALDLDPPPVPKEDPKKEKKSSSRRRQAEPPPSIPAASILQDEDTVAERETDTFLKQFEEQVRAEERAQTENFKDTLAEKFERERERYLRDLGINTDLPPDHPDNEQLYGDEPSPVAPQKSPEPARRRLDMQIQPEMHSSSPRPVTYNRSGGVLPQEDSGELPYIPKIESKQLDIDIPAPEAAKPQPPHFILGGRDGAGKSSEQLLMELATVNTMRAHKTPAPISGKPQKRLKFKYSEEPPEIKTKEPKFDRFFIRKIATVGVAAVVLVLSVALGPAAAGWIMDNGAGSSLESSSMSGLSGAPLIINESRRPDVRERYSDVIIRRGNVSVQNMSVDNHLVIDRMDLK